MTQASIKSAAARSKHGGTQAMIDEDEEFLNENERDMNQQLGHGDIKHFFRRTIKERQLKQSCFSMDPMRLMSVIDQQVESNNGSLFERVIDKEIFDKVFKGVRTALIP